MDTNFLSVADMPQLKLLNGKNNLDTCYQYCIKTNTGKANRQDVLNIKIYDKVLDLVSREYRRQIGCRANEFLGCKRILNALNKRLGNAKFKGITRVEVSVYPNVGDYNPYVAQLSTAWHKRIQAALHHICQDVLNETAVKAMCLRHINVEKLIGNLS